MSCESVRPSTRTGTSTFAVNARGILLTNQIAARHFVTKGAGCIVNTASRNGSAQRVVDDYLAQTPLGRLEEPEDVADVVAFLCSEQARFMSGQGINVAGGVYMT
jgi:NAD(P)-dependent dehydrogenase (short-subunit alcohol dehydrogenase family)